MRLANPIYDTVFKYLMEDTEIARLFLSRLIGEEITEIVVRPQEYSTKTKKHGVTVLRLDFKATIKLGTQEPKNKKDKKNWRAKYKTVLIELQKAKHNKDILRSRRYLGDNDRKKDDIMGADGKMKKEELPIVTVFILGFPLPPIKTSALKINRVYTDLITNEVLDVQTEFIEKLTHDCYAILITELPQKERSKLERILKIFNQTYILDSDNKFLEIEDKELKGDKLLELMSGRLRYAATDEEVLQGIEIEQEIEETIDQHIREKEELKEKLMERDEKLKERDEQLNEHRRLIEELKKQLKDKK